MKRFWTAGVVLGLILGLSIPVGAHLTEHTPATDPVTSMTVKMYEYPSGEPLACDTPDPTGIPFDEVEGIEPFPFSVMRIQVNIDSLLSGKEPPEHWTLRVQVGKAKILQPWKPLLTFRHTGWDQEWYHQNTAAHKSGRFHIITKTNLWGLTDFPGIRRVTVTLIGEESGNSLEHVCIFET